jgi:hypothetical protein
MFKKIFRVQQLFSYDLFKLTNKARSNFPFTRKLSIYLPLIAKQHVIRTSMNNKIIFNTLTGIKFDPSNIFVKSFFFDENIISNVRCIFDISSVNSAKLLFH